MAKLRKEYERERLLADVAEMYFEEGLTQDQIATAVRITRSTVSRLLTEAREKGILEIRIHRPLHFDEDLAAEMAARFGLVAAHVLLWQGDDYDRLRRYLGMAAAHVLTAILTPQSNLGVTWGTTVKATVDALEDQRGTASLIVQLVGASGARDSAYNAHALVQCLAEALRCEGVYMFAPFIVETPEMARSLRKNQGVREAIELARKCDIALFGVGTVDLYSSLYLGGHISLEEVTALRDAGAIGDAAGHHFNLEGHPIAADFHHRLVGMARDDLFAIPNRLGVAGGPAKVDSILGALRGGYVSILVTDSLTAAAVLQRDAGSPAD